MIDDIVLLATASSEVEAGMWNDALQAANIRTLIRPGGPGAGAWASAYSGNSTVKRAPCPGWLSSMIRPCIAPASSRQIARPRPLPP